MIPAHGATITVSPAEVSLRRSALAAALYGPGLRIPLADVAGVTVHATPTATECGTVLLDGPDITIVFSPNQQQQQQQFIDAITTAHSGEVPAVIPGMDFVAIDVETANADWGSICQVGVVRVIDGHVSAKQQWLCQPPASIDKFEELNIGIHGITPETVAKQPRIGEIIPAVSEFIGELPLVAHNAQFDMGALFRAAALSNVTPPTSSFGCTLALARHSNINFPSHNLVTVAETLGVPQQHHHDAGDDALTCAGIAIALAQHNEFIGDFLTFFQQAGFTPGTIDNDRVYPVLKTITGSPATQTSRSKKTSQRAAKWAKAATPEVIPEPNLEAPSDNLLFGQNVTLSGDFEPYDKGMLWERMANLGATIGKNVTKKTTILVCGPWDSVTSKQKRAEQLIAQGQEIALWTADQLYAVLGLSEETRKDEEPPF